MINRVAFSGRLRSGKDFVASSCLYRVIGLADPLYALCQYYFGTSNKEDAGVRVFLQTLGQIGFGYMDNDKYKLGVERAVLIGQLRLHGSKFINEGAKFLSEEFYDLRFEDFTVLFENSFSRDKEFWIKLLLSRLKNFNNEQRIAVTNCRFPHEQKPLKENGFEHYHIMCDERSWLSRLSEAEKNNVDDHSESFAKELDVTMDDEHIIWSDDKYPIPEGKNYLTIEQFKEIATK